MYPQGVPPEVLQEIEKDRMEKKAKKNKLCLNCVPGLKGKTNRQKFILKVYGILTAQLFITFSFIFITMLTPGIQEFMKATKWLYWTVLALTLTLNFSLFCFTYIAKRYPINYIALLIFTIGSSYILAGICIF